MGRIEADALPLLTKQEDKINSSQETKEGRKIKEAQPPPQKKPQSRQRGFEADVFPPPQSNISSSHAQKRTHSSQRGCTKRGMMGGAQKQVLEGHKKGVPSEKRSEIGGPLRRKGSSQVGGP